MRSLFYILKIKKPIKKCFPFSMLETLKNSKWAGKSIGIDHRPDINRNPGRFVRSFFDVLALPGVRPIVPGTTIETGQEIELNG